jgi:hypothetical protein
MKRAAEELGISYSTLYRIARDPDSPFLAAFFVMREGYHVDIGKFLEIAQQQAKKKALER